MKNKRQSVRYKTPVFVKEKKVKNRKKKYFQKLFIIEKFLFHEDWWWLRLSATSFFLLFWIKQGIDIMPAQNMSEVFFQVFQYAFAPLAALVGAFMLGGHYIQDIYELPNYSSALRYLWANIFNGEHTNFYSGFAAFSLSVVLFGWLIFSVFAVSAENNLWVIWAVVGGLLGSIFFGYVFGKKQLPEMTVSEGKKIFKNDLKTFDIIGGPGWVYVTPGNAILLERLDSQSDVLGSGRHFIHRLHRVRNIVSLKDQHASPRDLIAHSKDGIKVTVEGFQFRYRIHTGGGKGKAAKRRLRDPYPFSVEAVRNMTYKRNVTASGELAAWENVIQFGFDGAVLGFIRNNSLNRILVPKRADGNARKEIEEIINSEQTRKGLEGNGAELLWCDIGRFIVDKDIGDEKIKIWLAKLRGSATIIRAQGKAEVISYEERAQAEGQIAILQGIIQALEASGLSKNVDDNMWKIVISQSAQILETMSRFPPNNEMTDTEKKR